MSLSKTTRTLVFCAGLLSASSAAAEDIDLFQGGEDVTGNRPNVLFIIDNSANWARNDQGWPAGIKQGEAELSAMIQAISQQRKDIRIGLMMFAKGSGATGGGGYLRFGIRDMDKSIAWSNGVAVHDSVTNARKLQVILGGIRPYFNTDTEKVSAAQSNYDNVMYEAYLYFAGKAPYTGHTDGKRDYTGNGAYNVAPYKAGNVYANALSSSIANYNSPLNNDYPCAKNFIIFIGNGFPSNGTKPSVYGDSYINSKFNFNEIYTSTKPRWSDEWARFLREVGVPTTCITVDGAQICAEGRIHTYTINVFKDREEPDQTKLLKSMAAVGGGAYFEAKSQQDIVAAINSVLNEVQAVDSVFTSASLPVSVNTQGTYLNQIYMGVFRPDRSGRPRWLGNLKQYRFGMTTDANGEDKIYLADATTDPATGEPTPAVNSSTGFVRPTARSYWSYYKDPGFWAFSPKGVEPLPGSGEQGGPAYDVPDGDLVEKGGAAQRLRDLGPDSRKVFTCISRDGCTPGTTPALFNKDNQDVKNALNFTGHQVSLSRIGPKVTATVISGASMGLDSPSDLVTISNSGIVAYNDTWMAMPDPALPSKFTFQIPETPATPATGANITVASGAESPQQILSLTYDNNPLNATYGRALATTSTAHGFTNNQTVKIDGASPSVYNGSYRINVTGPTTFNYTPNLNTAEEPPALQHANDLLGIGSVSCGGGGTFRLNRLYREPVRDNQQQFQNENRGYYAVAVTNEISSGKCTPGVSAILSNVTDNNTPNGYNGYNNVGYEIVANDTGCPSLYDQTLWPPGKAFCFRVPVDVYSIVPASATGAAITASSQPTRNVLSMTRTEGDANNVAVVTILTDQPHSFNAAQNDSIFISGADQAEYNGIKTVALDGVTYPDLFTIKFKLTTGPAPTSIGIAARGYQVPPETLIEWIRGKDNKEDENINGSKTDVRASVHGDVLHSRPVVINYGGTTGLVAFYGGNDGMLRAVKAGDAGTDGGELWSFVSPEHYGTLGRLYTNLPVIKFPNTPPTIEPTPIKRNYFFDGNIGVYQSADLATTHIFVAMRRGGRAIYAFDVSDPNNPKFLWKRSFRSTGEDPKFAEMGYTFSEPKVIPIRKPGYLTCNTSNPDTFIRGLVFGAGYDPAEEDKAPGDPRSPAMGRGVFVLNAATGKLIKFLEPVGPKNAITGVVKKYSFASDVTLVDSDSDSCVDRLYAVDTGANIHRFDIITPATASGAADPSADLKWNAYHIAHLGDVGDNGGDDDRKFLYPLDAVMGYDGTSQVFYLLGGTGDREAPRDTFIQNHFFMVKDVIPVGTTQADAHDPLKYGYPRKIGNLKEVTVFDSNVTSDQNPAAINPYAADFKGWYYRYKDPATGGKNGEKSVNAPLTVAGVTYFGTNIPKSASNQCTPNLGLARAYAINFMDGTSAVGDRDKDGTVEESDLFANLIGGGLPPSPVSGIVKIDEKFVRFVIGAGGTGTNAAAVEGYKIRANPSSNRTRVYWYFKKDQ